MNGITVLVVVGNDGCNWIKKNLTFKKKLILEFRTAVVRKSLNFIGIEERERRNFNPYVKRFAQILNKQTKPKKKKKLSFLGKIPFD